MRFFCGGYARDRYGNILAEATVQVYLAGGTTAATIYAAGSGGVAIATGLTASDATGLYKFYVDDGDYLASQQFKVVVSKTGHETLTLDYLTIIASQSDQSLSTTSSPTFSGLTLSGLTASQLVKTSAGKALVSGETVGTTEIADAAVTYAKIQNVSATDKLLGRSTAGAGSVEEVACTAAGRALLDDATAAAQRTTLSVPYTMSIYNVADPAYGSIGAALAAATGGGIIYLPPGTYTLTAAVNVPYPVTIMGSGRDNTLVYINHATEHLFNVTATGSRVTFQDLSLAVHGDISSRNLNAALIYCNVAATVWIYRCLFYGLGGAAGAQGKGVHLAKGSGHSVLLCEFLDNKQQLVLEQPDAGGDPGDDYVVGNIFNLTSDDANTIAVLHKSGGGLRLVHNKFICHRYQYWMQVADGVTTGQLSVTDNNFDLSRTVTGGVSVRLEKEATTGTYLNYVIDGNVFSVMNAGNYGAILDEGASNGIFSGNDLYGLTAGVGLEFGAVSDWLAEGNTFVGLGTGVNYQNVAGNARNSVGINHFYNCTANLLDTGSKIAYPFFAGLQMSLGANDSGGSGYRLLRVPN